MSAMRVQEKISDALSQRSPDAVIRDVKHTVAREIEAIDSGVAIKATEYFTHTFIPDFVLTWDRDGEEVQRDVYLRHNIANPAIADDLEVLHDGGPLFLGLRTSTSLPEETAEQLEAYDDCLVSEASALEHFIPRESPTVISQIVNESLVRGAHGLLAEKEARNIAQSATRMEEEIAAQAAPAVGRGLEKLQSLFQNEYSFKIQRIAQVLWMSHGGQLEDFPGTKSLSVRLSERELARLLPRLLRSSLINDRVFWRQIGELVTLQILEALRSADSSGNLDLLINSNLDRISVTQMALRLPTPALFGAPQGFRWAIRDSILTLESPEFTLSFVADRRKIAKWRPEGRPPAWHEIQARVAEYSIEDIELIAPTARVDVHVQPRPGVHGLDNIDKMNAALGDYARVGSMRIKAPHSNRIVECDFKRSMVDGGEHPTDTRVLAKYGVDLIYQASEEFLAHMDEFFGETPYLS